MKTEIRKAEVSKRGLKASELLHPFDLRDAMKVHSGDAEVVCVIPDFLGTGVEADIVSSKSIIPHVDAYWVGHVFVSIAISADHDYFECLSCRQFSRTYIGDGSVWIVDPMKIHWLEQRQSESGHAIIASLTIPKRDKAKIADVMEKLIG